MELRVFLYKVTFEEVPHWYWGVHKERKLNDGYLGSPKTNRRFWDWYTPELEILELFEYSDEGWEEAREVEGRVIVPDLNNPLCLNEGWSGVKSLEVCRKAGRKGGPKGNETCRKLKVGFHDREVQVKAGKIGGVKSAESRRDRGVLEEQNSEAGKVGGRVTSSQRWQCLVTGHVCSAGSLTNWQRKRGIDTTLRIRLS